MADTQFPNIVRVDAHAKVMGAPIYAADMRSEGQLHAVFAVATVAKGKISEIDVSAARALARVKMVVTHEDVQGLKPAGFLLGVAMPSRASIPWRAK